MFYQVKTKYAAGGTEWDNVETEAEAKALAKRNKSRGAKVEVLLLKGKMPEESFSKKVYRSEATIRRIAEKTAGSDAEITSLSAEQGGGWMVKGESMKVDDAIHTTESNWIAARESLEANQRQFNKSVSGAGPHSANMPETSSGDGVFNRPEVGDDSANAYNDSDSEEDDEAGSPDADFKAWLGDVNSARRERGLAELAVDEAFDIYKKNPVQILSFGESIQPAN